MNGCRKILCQGDDLCVFQAVACICGQNDLLKKVIPLVFYSATHPSERSPALPSYPEALSGTVGCPSPFTWIPLSSLVKLLNFAQVSSPPPQFLKRLCILLCVYECLPACVYVYHACVCLFDSLEMGLLTVVNSHVGAENQT